jgi:hypothetical protein
MFTKLLIATRGEIGCYIICLSVAGVVDQFWFAAGYPLDGGAERQGVSANGDAS